MNRHSVSLISVSSKVAAIFVLSTFINSNIANSALLSYDPFAFGPNPALGQYALGNEDAGTNLIGGQNPVIGPTPFYSGAWIQSGGDSQVVKNLPSLSYPGLAPGQGGIQQETKQFSCCSFGRSGRALAAGGLGGGAARTIYQSFLIDFGSQGADAPGEFGFRGHELWNGGIGDSFKAVDLFLSHFNGTNVLSLRVETASGDSTVPVTGGGNLNALAGTHLVVMKYVFNPVLADSVSVFLDPTVGLGEPGLAQAHISVLTSDLFITHQGAYTQFTFSGSTHVPGAIDEIRWGDNFGDVTPVPEPATALLVVLGACLLRRRR